MLDYLSICSLTEAESRPSSVIRGEIHLKRVGEQVSSLLRFFTFFKESAQKSSVFLSLGELGVNFASVTHACLMADLFIFKWRLQPEKLQPSKN